MQKLYILLFFISLLASCKSSDTHESDIAQRNLDYDRFGSYWYQGQAELNTYNLEQYRYGEKRDGEAVLIFVTEDFSRDKQVKLDNPENDEKDAQKVMKLNMTKKFLTGIYPYSMMVSVFTPVYDSIPSVKVTASSQEWCGHTFTQLNRKEGSYQAQLLSYFERESDQNFSIDAMPEDNLWTLIRLNPSQVPIGEVKLIPALLDQRMTHEPLEAEVADITIKAATDSIAGLAKTDLHMLEAVYRNYPRTLRIFYTKAFPFDIVGWEEVRPVNGGEEISRATRKAKLLNDYWTKNKNENEVLRQDLELK